MSECFILLFYIYSLQIEVCGVGFIHVSPTYAFRVMGRDYIHCFFVFGS